MPGSVHSAHAIHRCARCARKFRVEERRCPFCMQPLEGGFATETPAARARPLPENEHDWARARQIMTRDLAADMFRDRAMGLIPQWSADEIYRRADQKARRACAGALASPQPT